MHFSKSKVEIFCTHSAWKGDACLTHVALKFQLPQLWFTCLLHRRNKKLNYRRETARQLRMSI